VEGTLMTMTRRSLFGLALLPVMPAPVLAKRSGLAPGHISADPPLLVDSPTAWNELCRSYARVNNIRWRVVSDSNRPETATGAEIGQGG
jgi:hypothetical protein